jgi:hypothetical protein
MAPHPNIFSFGNNYGTPPVSNRASVVSVDTILSDSSAHERSFSTPEASRIADSRIKGALTSLVIEPSGSGGRASAHPETDPSFTKHEKYFFKDGNVTFLVRDQCQPRVVTLDSLFAFDVGRWLTLLRPSLFLLSRLGVLFYSICSTRHP